MEGGDSERPRSNNLHNKMSSGKGADISSGRKSDEYGEWVSQGTAHMASTHQNASEMYPECTSDTWGKCKNNPDETNDPYLYVDIAEGAILLPNEEHKASHEHRDHPERTTRREHWTPQEHWTPPQHHAPQQYRTTQELRNGQEHRTVQELCAPEELQTPHELQTPQERRTLQGHQTSQGHRAPHSMAYQAHLYPQHVPEHPMKFTRYPSGRDPSPVSKHPVTIPSPLETDEKKAQTSSRGEVANKVSNRFTGEPIAGVNQPIRVIVLGNPGVGKSTIQNSLMGEALFKSGISLGGGLTKRIGICERERWAFVDTPGLDDIYHRNTAAQELSKAFRGPCAAKIVFITALEAGRVRAADVCTLMTIVAALRKAGVELSDRYALIVNKCEPSLAENLASVQNHELRAKVLDPFVMVEKVSQVRIVGLESSLRGKSGVLLNDEESAKLRELVEHTPTIYLPAKPEVNLDVGTFEQATQMIEEGLNQHSNDAQSGARQSRIRTAENERREKTHSQKKQKRGLGGIISSLLDALFGTPHDSAAPKRCQGGFGDPHVLE